MTYLRRETPDDKPPKADESVSLNGIYFDYEKISGFFTLEVFDKPLHKKYIEIYVSPNNPLFMDIVKAFLHEKRRHETARQDFKDGK